MNNNNFPYNDKWKASPGIPICPYVRYGIYSDDFQEVHKMVNGSTRRYSSEEGEDAKNTNHLLL
jgi:hypothetical protein